MEPQLFRIIALTPAGQPGVELVAAAGRAGCLGIVNAEIGPLPVDALRTLAKRGAGPFGLKLGRIDRDAVATVVDYAGRGLEWLVIEAAEALAKAELLEELARLGVNVVPEATEWDDRLASLTGHAALLVKGHEAG